MHARFDVSGEVRIFVVADYSTYPANLAQRFSVTVRFRSGAAAAGSTTYAPWHFDVVMHTQALNPSFERLEPTSVSFQRLGLGLSSNQTIEMGLIDARWSLSPQQGREAWPMIQAEVVNFRTLA